MTDAASIERTKDVLVASSLAQLGPALDLLDADRSARGLVVAPGVGFDRSSLLGLATQREGEELCRAHQRLCARVAASAKPVVVACEKVATDLGLAFAARALAFGPGTASRATSELDRALLPGPAALPRLAARAGLRRALGFALSGRHLDDATARRLGLDVQGGSPVVGLGVALVTMIHHKQMQSSAPPAPPSRLQALERHLVARRVLFRRALAEASKRPPVRRFIEGREARVVEVLEAYGARGFVYAGEVEARVFGELAISSASQRLLELEKEGRLPRALDVAELRQSFLTEAMLGPNRLVAATLFEARCLRAEGLSPDAIDDAARAWGFSWGPCALLTELGAPVLAAAFAHLSPRFQSREPVPASRPASPPTIEEIQMRLALAFVNEAVHALDDAAFSSPIQADRAAVAMGFPAFRGGPLRYADTLGLREVLHRLEAHARLGERWAPASKLVLAAGQGSSFHS